MKKWIVLILSIICWGCNSEQEKNKPITHAADYVEFLTPKDAEERMEQLEQEEKFWLSKLTKAPGEYLYLDKLAQIQEALFNFTGDVIHLDQQDSLLQEAMRSSVGKRKAAYYMALSSIAIKRHDFKKALTYGYQASQYTDEQFGPLMMQFDAAMELGEYGLAYNILDQNQRLDDFDYLVRLAKYQDHVGDLDSAIVLVEKAKGIAGNQKKKLWASVNLGDMYGHAGRLEDAYATYLKVLKQDPDYTHALRGIAWLAYSNDDKKDEAERIMKSIKEQTALPDAYLMLAELAEASGNEQGKDAYLDSFMNESTQAKYTDMYNKYIIEILAKDHEDVERALDIARREVTNRPTPATYAQLAWCMVQNGEHKEALRIAQVYVENKSHEPEILYQLGTIYLCNQQTDHAIAYLEACLDASFELGLSKTKEIKQLLQNRS
ncbi:MAG: hypothetical protein AAFX87_24090 [Bacteroidota bacterium]